MSYSMRYIILKKSSTKKRSASSDFSQKGSLIKLSSVCIFHTYTFLITFFVLFFIHKDVYGHGLFVGLYFSYLFEIYEIY